MRRAVARQRNGMTHEIEIRGHTVLSDEPPSVGGEDRGPTPQELIAGALAACTAMTVRMYAQRKGWDVSGLEVTAESDPTAKGACGPFVVTLRVPEGLSPEQIERLRAIARKCPVHRTLAAPEGCVIEDRVQLAQANTLVGSATAP